MTHFDSPGAAVPPTPRAITKAPETTSVSLRPALHRPFGRSIVDKMTDTIGTPLHKLSPLFGHPWDNSAPLRTVLGNAYLIFPAAGAYLGARALKDTHGLAIPPVLWLTLTIMVLGILDAFSGLVATAVFTVGVIVTGHLFSTHLVTGPPGTQGMLYAFTGLLSVSFIWFIGPQLPRRVRLLGFNAIKNTFQRRYVIVGDFFVVTLLMILILGSVPIFVPIFTGADKQSLTQVVMQNHLVIIKWVVGVAAFVRVGLDEIVHANFEQVPKSVGRERGPVAHWILRIVASLIALALVWEILGTIWQWPVVWVLLISLDVLSAIGERFLKPSAIYRYVPRNLFRIVTLLLLCQYGARVLSGHVVTGVELLGWLVLLVACAIAIYAILDGPEDENEGDRPATWITRIIGIIVVILLFILSQGLVAIPVTPYANPTAVAVSSSGTLYIADSGNNRVVEVTVSGERFKVGEGLSNPSGVAPDPNSSPVALYIADTGNNRVLHVQLTPRQALVVRERLHPFAMADATGSQSAVGTGLKHPTGLATDARGRLFIADTGNNRIVEITPSGVQTTIVSGLHGPLAVSADVFGHLYVADSSTGEILRYDIAKSGAARKMVVFAKGLSNPAGVAADAQGNVFVADTGNNRIFEYMANHQQRQIAGDFLDPRGLAVDGAGHLYVADATHGEIIGIEPHFFQNSKNVGPSRTATAVTRGPGGSTFVVSADAGTLERVTAHGNQVIETNLDRPNGVAWSTATRRLYVAQQGNGTILQINVTTGAETVISQGLTGITSIAPDPYGGLFAISPTTKKIFTVSAQGVSHVLYTSKLTPTSIVQDAYDFLDVTFVGSAANSGAVWRIVPGGRAQILATGLKNPGGITADFNGDIFYIERGMNRVWEDRGLLGAQQVFQGLTPATDPSAISADLNGNLIIYPFLTNRTIELRNSTNQFSI